ncbi:MULTISPECIES: hypothetical protein [unclassified Chryseobacterium]|uniref:hypothetical protein n=1 Tax=unclassified Chryseobacterium TaxID=2593645 RepID=UPI000D389ED9|nr:MULTISPECIES: hypothetical protein [unclassified Chryseobacterium]PTT32867.1 hypothetical protein DBR28_15040 [Chryseobacterium sp. HMWF028]PTT75827.1 hypothetical protein DBR25_07430 [Chryseobacterium sp. HMWF001]PVV50520.1 hypothetical protein DD829_22065 [Chryseobacterium sp. HMWF035]
MKTSFYLILFLLFTGLTKAQQSATGEKEIQEIVFKSLENLEKEYSVESLRKESQMMERLSSKYKNDWGANYYLLYFKLLTLKETKSEDEKNDIFNFCSQNIGKLFDVSKNDREKSEAYALKGFLYLTVVSMDPMKYGRNYSGEIVSSFDSAIKINNNPRALFLNTLFKEGMAQFLKSKYPELCKELFTANKFFAEDLSMTSKGNSVYPTWGATVVANKIIQSCSCKNE